MIRYSSRSVSLYAIGITRTKTQNCIASCHQSRWLHIKASQVGINNTSPSSLPSEVRYNSSKSADDQKHSHDSNLTSQDKIEDAAIKDELDAILSNTSPHQINTESKPTTSTNGNDNPDSFAATLKRTLEDIPLTSSRNDLEASNADPLDLDSLMSSFKDEEDSPKEVKSNNFQSQQGSQSIVNNEQQKFDDLLASLDFSSGTDPSSIQKTDEQQASKAKDEKFRPVDLDKSDENVYEFEDTLKEQVKRANFIREERNLLQNIFTSYITETPKADDASNKIEKEALWSIRDSLTNTRKSFDHALSSRKTSFHNVSKELKSKLFKRTEEALKPTFDHVDKTLTTPLDQVNFVRQLLDQWLETKHTKHNKDDTIQMQNEFYLNDLFDNEDSLTLKPKHRKFINRVEWTSEETPLTPKLNVITMPLIFNKILSNFSNKFYNGQLALSLFNLLKQDLELYTVLVSQQTYNEILKTYWIYYGKSNLYGIEMLFSEMRNNGFNGDLSTINIVKQILLDYHSLKLGKVSANLSQSNTQLKVPIWTKEDDIRAANLERQLHSLAAALEKEYLGF